MDGERTTYTKKPDPFGGNTRNTEMANTKASLLSTAAGFSFDDFGNEGVLALVADNGEWAWVKPVVYAEYAVSSVCVTLELSENSDGEIPDVVSEIVEALFTREFGIKFSTGLTADGAFDAAIQAALAEATVLYDRFNAGDYTPFNDVAHSDPEGDKAEWVDAWSDRIAAMDVTRAQEAEEDERLRLDYSNALINLDDITVAGSTTADVQKAFDELMYAALDNPHGQDVIREAKEVLEGTQWQLSEVGDQVIERLGHRIALADVAKPLLWDLMSDGRVEEPVDGEIEEVDGVEAFEVRDFTFRVLGKEEARTGLAHVVFVRLAGRAGVCVEFGSTSWFDADTLEEAQRAWADEEDRALEELADAA